MRTPVVLAALAALASLGAAASELAASWATPQCIDRCDAPQPQPYGLVLSVGAVALALGSLAAPRAAPLLWLAAAGAEAAALVAPLAAEPFAFFPLHAIAAALFLAGAAIGISRPSAAPAR